MWNVTFWKDAVERAIKSAAQALILVWTGAEVFDVLQADWALAGGAALGAAVLSLLTSVASAPFGSPGASLVVETVPGS